MKVGAGDGVAIAGFVISGSSSKKVAVRALGPSLSGFGISSPLADPMLTLVRSSDQTVVASNDSWQQDNNAAQLSAAGFAPSNGSEAAVLVTLPPGAYTAVVSGANGTVGTSIVEVYEVDAPQAPAINLSTRGQILDGDDVMIGGFVVGGAYPQTVVIRALGPSLAAFGVEGTIANPSVTLVRMADNTVVATNDDWASSPNAARLSSTGFAPSDPRESAILVTLEPGAYTAIVRGADGSTGVGMVEVYAQ
jgi:hypothetical protein